MTDWQSLAAGFRQQFPRGGEPTHGVVSPGRINLIGDHIDYCGGHVLPMAIEQSTHGLYRANGTSTINVFSTRTRASAALRLTNVVAEPVGGWQDYIQGVLRASGIRRLGAGFDLYLHSDINWGGLSSSASLTAAISLVLFQVTGGTDLPLDEKGYRLEIARQCQRAENEFVGLSCGIMDPVAVLLGGARTLDCTNLATTSLDFSPAGYSILVINSGVPRRLAVSGYNERVAETDAIVDQLSRAFGLRRLVELPPEALPEACALLENDTLERRLRHVVSEHQRVGEAADAIAANDWRRFGQLMLASHASLSGDFAVSTPELDFLVDQLATLEGVAGARLTGAGFGGNLIALVADDALASVQAELTARYREAFRLQADYLVTHSAPGTRTMPVAQLP